jgi:hypothetical protein
VFISGRYLRQPDGDALGRLAQQRRRELLADRARAEPVLVDVNRRRGRGHVLEHRREQALAADVDVGRGRGALAEGKRQVGEPHRVARQAQRVLARIGHRKHRRHAR